MSHKKYCLLKFYLQSALPEKLRQGLLRDSEDLRCRIGRGLDITEPVPDELLVATKLRRFGLRNIWLLETIGVLVSLPPPPLTPVINGAPGEESDRFNVRSISDKYIYYEPITLPLTM